MARHLLAEATGALTSKRSLPGAFWPNERGNVAIMTGMLALPLVGFSALAVDVGIWEMNKSAMQGAADQAALAAGLTMSVGPNAARQEAKGVAAAHGFVHGADSVNVTVNIPPTTGSYAGVANAVEVVITQQQDGFLSKVVLSSAPVASAKAVVVPKQGATCVVALATEGIGITSSGNAELNASGCNIYVNSTAGCSVTASGSSKVKGYDLFLASQPPACTSGSGSISASNSLNFSAPAAGDPYLGRTIPRPASPCMPQPGGNKGAYSLTPGTYCSLSFGAHDTATLASGLYILDGGDLSLSGSATLTGTNVSLVFTGHGSSYGRLSLSGNSSINLTAMRSGPTAGMAVWLDALGGKPFSHTGSTVLNITGAFYAPASAFSSSGNANSPCTQLIAKTITLSGSSTLQHDCDGYGVLDVVGSSGYKLKE